MRETFSIQSPRGELRLGRRTAIMGIVNVTPDSFSDGGLFLEKDRAVEHSLRLVEEGADIIDIGGESTRPGAEPLNEEEEIRRVVPVIEEVAKRTDVPISVDTYKSQVAKAALDAGAAIINDISGLHFDPQMAKVAARYDAPVVIMHIKGTPKTMQQNPQYRDLMGEIISYHKEGIKRAEDAGLDPQKVIIDPGIGFGKTLEHNLKILRDLGELKALKRPILIGPSRKNFIGAILNVEVTKRLYGTLASVALAVANGAHIVRVHDVKATREAVDVVDAIINGEG